METFTRYRLGMLSLQQWAWLLVVLVGATVLCLALQWAASKVGQRLSRKENDNRAQSWVDAVRAPGAFILWAMLVQAGIALRPFSKPAMHWVGLGVRSAIIIGGTWLLLRVLHVVVGWATVGGEDMRARSLRTQLSVGRRVLQIAVCVVGGAMFFLQFDSVRAVGVSLLASAGLLSVVLGFAAQKSISTIFAGLQLSFTQPIRLGDNVVVEGQFGTVEEIRLTYVVVRTWDWKRLVVPVSHFFEKTFENWSLVSTELLGAVTLQLDFITDVDVLRAELKGLLQTPEAKAWWDGKSSAMQVTECDGKVMTLRVLVGAANPSQAFDLRCLVRERLLAFIARENPQWLPRFRAEGLTVVPEPLPLPRQPAP